MTARYIHLILTLGTTTTNAPGPLFDSLRGDLSTEKVLSLAAVGMGFKGPDWRSLMEGSYTFCFFYVSNGCGSTVDGITSIRLLLGLKGILRSVTVAGSASLLSE